MPASHHGFNRARARHRGTADTPRPSRPILWRNSEVAAVRSSGDRGVRKASHFLAGRVVSRLPPVEGFMLTKDVGRSPFLSTGWFAGSGGGGGVLVTRA